MRPQRARWRTASASGVLVLAAVATPSIDAQPVVARGTTLNAGACPEAGKGVLAGKMWMRCGPSTISDGTIRMSIDSEVEGAGSAMKHSTDTAGKRCDVMASAGVLTLTAGSYKASAALDGEPEDSIVRTDDGRTFINASTAKGQREIALEFDPKSGVQSAQAKTPARMVTCSRDS